MNKLKLTPSQIEQAYEIFQGNFFEGNWLYNQSLSESLVNWTKMNYPHVYEEVAAKEGVYIEMFIKDEEDPGMIAEFINSLPNKLKKEALEGIVEDLESMENEEAEGLIKEIHQLIEEIE